MLISDMASNKIPPPKAKEKEKEKSQSKPSPAKSHSPKPLSKTPPKSSGQKSVQPKHQTQKQSINKKNSLFSIPQFVDSAQENHKLNAFKQNLSFAREDKTKEKDKIKQKDEDFEFDQRYPNFEKTSVKVSEKQYHVSLAGSIKAQTPNQNQAPLSPPSNSKPGKKLKSKSGHGLNPNIKTKHEFETEEEIDEWLAANLKNTNNESVKIISDQFRVLIEQPLKIQEELANSPTPIQRCLAHNTPFSLYCSIDRQLLCVNCIYSQKSHKNHQIIPLVKSQKQMKEDMEGFKNRVDATLAQSQSLIRQASLNLIRIQKEYPILIKSIDNYYTSIHAMIDQKRDQQMEYISSLREEYKKELKTINGLLNKLSNVFHHKLKEIEREAKSVVKEVYYVKNQEKLQEKEKLQGGGREKSPEKEKGEKHVYQMDSAEILLNCTVKHRCEYEILSRFHKILTKNSDLLFEDKKPFNVNLENFQHVVNMIKYKLAIVVPVLKKQENKKPWIVDLLGEEGARELAGGENNIRAELKIFDKKKSEGVVEEGGKTSRLENRPVAHRKGFSTSPIVPKGISRRFL